MTKHPFVVRQVKSGYTGIVKYMVVKNPGGRRVSTELHPTRETAQAEADTLNVVAMVKDHADDPRPFAARLAEAEAAYYTEQEAEQ